MNNPSRRPIIWGVLSSPETRWPDTLGRIHCLRQHPYFLPCATSGFIAFVTFILSFFGLKEILIQSTLGFLLFTRLSSSLVAARKQRQVNQVASDDTITPDAIAKASLINHKERIDYGATDTSEQHQSSLSSTSEYDFSRPKSYASSSFLTRGLLFVIWTMPPFYHSSIWAIWFFYRFSIPHLWEVLVWIHPQLASHLAHGTLGLINAVIQTKLLGPLIRKYGVRKLYVVSCPCLFTGFTLYPVMRFLAQLSGRVLSALVNAYLWNEIHFSFSCLLPFFRSPW